MKPKHYKPQYAVAQTVADMARKFVFPDVDTLPGPPFVAGGGGTPTVVVAAADASDLSKGKADYVCTGVDDHGTLLAACNLLASTGGRVFLTEGTYNVDTGEWFLLGDIWVQGTGRETIVSTASTTGRILDMEFDCAVSDVTFMGPGPTSTTIGVGASTRNIITRCGFDSLFRGIGYSGDRDIRITENFASGVSEFLQAVSTLRLVVANNTIESQATAIAVTGSNMVVAHNTINCSGTTNGVITTGSGSDVAVVGNTIIGGGVSVNAFISIGTNYTSVIGNALEATSSGPVLIVTAIDGTVIADNNLAHAGIAGDDSGIEITPNSYGSVVTGNRIEGGLFGIVVDGDGTVVEGNMVDQPVTEGIHIEGDNNLVASNRVESDGSTTYGINIAAGDCNIVAGNALGPVAGYGTDALNDAGTNTQLFWPNDATYGDNFTDCPPSSS